MPFNASWLIAAIGTIIAITVWAKTKRVAPGLLVFVGGIAIMMMADPKMLESLSETGKELLQQAVHKVIPGGGSS